MRDRDRYKRLDTEIFGGGDDSLWEENSEQPAADDGEGREIEDEMVAHAIENSLADPVDD